MNRQIATLETMQADHRVWLDAHAKWRRGIERWQAEHKAAATRLAELQKIVAEHGECLEEHAKAFREVEEAIANHEQEIAGFQAGAGKEPQDVLANRHQEQEGAFSRQKDAHERIEKHHEAVLAQMQALEESASAPM